MDTGNGGRRNGNIRVFIPGRREGNPIFWLGDVGGDPLHWDEIYH